MSKFTFNAEVKEVKSRKLASLDVDYKVVLLTDNDQVLDLGRLSGDTMLKITVEIV